MIRMHRRTFLPVVGAVAAAACTQRNESRTPPPGNSAVAVLRAETYSGELLDLFRRGAALCGLDVRDKRVLLKPNLVEFDSETCINTDVAVLSAAVELMESLGAAEVIIGEGPGHRRDTLFLAEQAKYRESIARFDERFVDLNVDDVTPTPGFLEEEIYLPNTALGADLIVSIPKMKAHHWVGATLSMKNFFGVVPGGVYGWPKNQLHYHGIHRSIEGLQRIFRKTFAIVDGIVGMEGNGPIQGSPIPVGAVVMGYVLVAVDATCCRIMGIDPARVDYIRQVADLGQMDSSRIEQRGERPALVRRDFELVEQFQHLRLA